MHEKYIFCPRCSTRYKTTDIIFRCEKCSGALEVIFDYSKLKKAVKLEKLQKRPFNHARYLEFFPVKNLVSLQEGGTPLIRSKNLEREFGLKFDLYFKYEAVNPTGSFKDRGSSVEIARAIEQKKKNVICASTGNMGASLAAYSSRANLNCNVIVPEDAVHVKTEQILAYGAGVYQIKGSYSDAAELVDYAFRSHDAYLTGDYLHRREGTKSIGFELAEQTKSDYVFCPVGNGTLISAVWKGFAEFKELGFIKKLPRMVAIQAEKCNPLTKAYRTGKEIKPMEGHTMAVAMECGDPLDGEKALKSVKDSRGYADHVSDNDIIRARELLARREGLFAEPAGAASLAGILKGKEKIARGSVVVCLVTGHGLKTPRTSTYGSMKQLGKTHKAVDSLF
ncbi:MAG: threonine synthase [Candidatus Aenigmatarchaeota archaeon]|nr:threonine synthase [Nanoarchaeota archaeon]